MTANIDRYKDLIDLEKPAGDADPAPSSAAEREPYVNDLLAHLLEEHSRNGGAVEPIPEGYAAKRRMLRALLTVRGPEPLPIGFLDQLDRLLARETLDRGVVDVNALSPFAPKMALWRGDITRLKAGAIVNAANGSLLGCFTPFHMCIDNVIHCAAGPSLREDCHRIVSALGREEPEGCAKITRGYNLPSDFVLHTVGPVWRDDSLAKEYDGTLASCYRSCLDLASQVPSIRSVVFCSISTGVFGFPKERAARVALAAVGDWLDRNPDALDLVVFNVFGQEDLEVYERAISSGS